MSQKVPRLIMVMMKTDFFFPNLIFVVARKALARLPAIHIPLLLDFKVLCSNHKNLWNNTEFWVPQNVFFGRPDKLPTCVAAEGVLLEDWVQAFARPSKLKLSIKTPHTFTAVQAWHRHSLTRDFGLSLEVIPLLPLCPSRAYPTLINRNLYT